MKYHYFYQTSKNEALDDWIVAQDRNDAYRLLRKKGIRPYKMIGGNPREWKRWTAIAVLGIVSAVAITVAIYARKSSRPVASELRSQLYGDPATIQLLSANGWRGTFKSASDAWLARHAVPGANCDCKDMSQSERIAIAEELLRQSKSPLDISQDESPELVKMKRLINGMKNEFAEYVSADGSSEDYMLLCDERLVTERRLRADFLRDFERLEKDLSVSQDAKAREGIISQWERKNETLRSMGLKTVPLPVVME